jgi:hypothetical protein
MALTPAQGRLPGRGPQTNFSNVKAFLTYNCFAVSGIMPFYAPK